MGSLWGWSSSRLKPRGWTLPSLRTCGISGMASEWDVQSLSDLCSYIGRGSAPAYIEQGGVLVLNQKCVRGGFVDLSLARRTDPSRKPIDPERILRPFDVLVNSTGAGTLGRVAQTGGLLEPVTVDSHITIVRP